MIGVGHVREPPPLDEAARLPEPPDGEPARLGREVRRQVVLHVHPWEEVGNGDSGREAAQHVDERPRLPLGFERLFHQVEVRRGVLEA